ncbi:MAG: calcineurin-like phosphoesterase family protein [Bacteroidales bacterium]
MIKKITTIALTAFLVSITGLAQTQVTGFVYEDLNGNNKLDRKEKGIANAPVSNGKEVVTTDKEGKYTLPIQNDNIVFVIKPSGYTTPVNEYNIPQYYYIHKPEGSPELEYAGSPPTGPLPKEVNFGLVSQKESDTFSILVFGDPQSYTEEEVDFFHRAVAAELKNVQNVEFGITMGDLVGDDLELLHPYKAAIRQIGIPWRNVLGNHDINFDVEHDSLSDETFETHFGPATYSFNQGKVHFIVLDDVLYPDPRDERVYWGGLREDQFAFIENDLKLVPKDHLIVLAFHILISKEDKSGPFNPEHRNRLFQLLRDFPHTLSLSAHTHIQNQLFFGPEHGWQQEGSHHHYNVGTTSGDWYSGKLNERGIPVSTMRDGTPKGYAYLNFNGTQYTIDYKVFDKAPEYKMAVFTPNVVLKDAWPSARIIVNFFLGGEQDSLFCKIDDGEWEKMDHTPVHDPFYVREVVDWDFTEELFPGSRPSNPAESSHTWTGFLPTDLEAGEHTVYIRAHDMFGREYTAERKFTIVAR